MIGQIFIGIAAFIHIYIFAMESLLWGKPRINKVFALTSEQAEQNRLFAFNQGFYNLFLAIAGFLGIALVNGALVAAGKALMIYSAASMLGAALVLLGSSRGLIRPALIQGLPPLLGLIFLALQ